MLMQAMLPAGTDNFGPESHNANTCSNKMRSATEQTFCLGCAPATDDAHAPP